jgi:hypothetical protein
LWNLKKSSHFSVPRKGRNIVLYEVLKTDDYTINVNWEPVRIKVWLSAELNEASCILSRPFQVIYMLTASHIPFQLTLYSRLHKSTSCVDQNLSSEVSASQKILSWDVKRHSKSLQLDPIMDQWNPLLTLLLKEPF